MNSAKDVVKLLVAYPDSDNALAKVPHMYICISSDGATKLLKCQSLKPYHLRRGSLPRKRFVVDVDKLKSPFSVKTVVDLDKIFISVTPTTYPVVGRLSGELFEELLTVFDYETAEKIKL